MGALCVACVVVLAPVPVAAVSDVCVARTSSSPGNLRWQLRQASGLTSLASMPNVLFTHNDRGIKDSPAPGEDTTDAAVWAIGPNGQALARFRLTSGGNPIPYFDTEAISRDPQGRLVLADTGTNVDGRVTVAVYRFTPPVVTAGQAYVEQDVAAEVIPLAYYANATTSTRTKLNVEAMAIDLAGNAWFVPERDPSVLVHGHGGGAEPGLGGTTPARAVRSTRLAVDGPMTDASFSPDGTMLLVKSIDTVYAYDVRTTTIATALGRVPCAAAFASRAKAPGYGEAVVAATTAASVTVAEGSKTQHTGQSSALWSFAV